VHSFRSYRVSSLAAPFVGLILSGCSPRDVMAPESRFNFTNGPATPGPYIVRIANAGSRVITTDPEDGLLAIHGRVSDLTECTDATTRVPVDIQIVRTPAAAQTMALLLTGSVNDVAIYGEGDPSDLNPFDPAKFCPFIEQVTPLYTGAVQYRLHINGQGNLLFLWEGFVVRTADGARLHYVEQQYAVPRPDGALAFLIEDIRLRPIGH